MEKVEISKEDKRKNRSDTLNRVLDAKNYIVITEDIISMDVSHEDAVNLICLGLTQNDAFRSVICEAIGSVAATCGALQGGDE